MRKPITCLDELVAEEMSQEWSEIVPEGMEAINPSVPFQG